MDSRYRMTFALISGIVIVAVSMTVAYISFKILESSAAASLQDWKLGGAFAGFVFTASMLTSIVFQFYKQMTAEQVETYREQIQELQAKLIKGAPCPPDYTIDIDERHKLVFTRPSAWIPLNGFLYQYVRKPSPPDILPANFNVIYQSESELEPFGFPVKVDVDGLYKTLIDAGVGTVRAVFQSYENGNLAEEYISVDGIKSAKYVHTYTYSTKERGDQGEGQKINMRQSGIFTYVPRLKALYNFTFSDNVEDFMQSSEVFNNVISSIRFL